MLAAQPEYAPREIGVSRDLRPEGREIQICSRSSTRQRDPLNMDCTVLVRVNSAVNRECE